MACAYKVNNFTRKEIKTNIYYFISISILLLLKIQIIEN